VKLEKCPVCEKLCTPGSCGCPVRVNKPVAFNLEDPYEAKLYRHLKKQGPFSKYVKRLIDRDMSSAT
jgi:rRNA maturation protein Nop10